MTQLTKKDETVPALLALESTRFGSLEVEEDALVEFPLGLIGLKGTSYALLETNTDAPFRWLHSASDPSLALVVTDPSLFFADYAIELSDEQVEATGLTDSSETQIWVTVRTGSDPAGFTVNLKAPILIQDGRGFQVINTIKEMPVRAPLFTDGVET